MKRPLPTVPRHIAIILDGNGRWAKQRGLARIFGHEEGSRAVSSERGRLAANSGSEFLTLYAFSTENWQRPKAEVAALMTLLQKFLKDTTPELIERNVRLQAIGSPARTARRLPAPASRIHRDHGEEHGSHARPCFELQR